MIVLASVSINAIVGDNGIITQAQNATIQNSIANLEEYLQELYVENYDTIANSSYESKLEGLAGITAYKYYFYNPSRDSSVGALSYISTSDGYVLYLINKSKLPEEIQELLIGGDAGDGEYSDYASLNDVYGVTKDLKVYYCSGGMDTITGIASTELDTDNLSRPVFSSLSDSKVYNLLWYNLLSNYDTNGDGDLTVQELRSVKTLTISSSAGISSLSELYNLTSLGELTLDSLEIDNIDGIENAVSLYYVYFKSCVIEDYTALCDVSNLEYLYFYDIDDEELETACTDIATTDFSKLTYLAVVGNTSFISSTFTSQDLGTNSAYSGKSTNIITTLASLDILSETTKSAVQYLSIQNNNIEGDLSYISDYTNLILLRCEYNSLTSLSGLEDMNNLKYLCGAYNSLGNGSNISDDSISSLAGNTSLYALNLVYNTDLAYVDDLEECTAIRYLYLSGCSSSLNVNTIAYAGIIENCTNYSLSVIYVEGTIFNLSEYSSYFTESEFSDDDLTTYLYKNKTITHLNLEYATSLTNSALNEVLETMTQLKYVTLRGCTGLTSIDFVHELTENEDGNETGVTGLIELDLRDTNATDLTNLNDYATSLCTLRISNTSIELTTIQETINRLSYGGTYWDKNTSGFVIEEYDLAKKLEDCSELTSLYSYGASVSGKDINLSGCGKLSYYFSKGWECSITLPSSITSVTIDTSWFPIFVSGTGSVSISVSCTNASCFNNSYEAFFSSLSNCSGVEFSYLCYNGGTDFDCSVFELSAGANVTYLNVGVRENRTAVVSIINISGLSVFAETLTTLKLERLTKITDYSEIAYLTELRNLEISYSSFVDLNVVSELQYLQTLTVNDNLITKLHPLQNLTNLAKINLQNNVIYDTAVDDDGNSYNNLQILIDLYNNGSLRTLYISGNKFTEDTTTNSYYKTLLSLDWTDSDF